MLGKRVVRIVATVLCLACGWSVYQLFSVQQYEQKNTWKKSLSGKVQFLDSYFKADLYINPNFPDRVLAVVQDFGWMADAQLGPKLKEVTLFWIVKNKQIDVLDKNSYYWAGKNIVVREELSGWNLYIALVDFEPEIKWTQNGVSFLAAPKQKVMVTYPSQNK